MRAFRISLLVLLVFVVAGGVAWLLSHQSKTQTISLPDGSRLTLLKVTQSTNHVFRFGNRWQDFLHPVLPAKLRAKFLPRVMAFDSFNPDSVMVWFRRDSLPPSGVVATPLYLSVADEHGLESPLQMMAHTTRTTGLVATTTNTSATQFSGWELASYPKRSRQFRVLAFCPADNKLARVGEFQIQNPLRRKLPVWTAEPLPAIRRTNGLEVALTRLETGFAGVMSGPGLRMPARVFSRATFKLSENGVPTENWSVSNIRLSSASGESRFGDGKSAQWQDGEHKADVWGGIWLEEPAWKLDVDFARTAGFPAEDLWGVRGVRVPQPGEEVECRVETNRHAVTLEFLGVNGLKARLPAAQVMPAYAIVHIRTPYPLEELRVVLVEVRDDRGRTAQRHGSTNSVSTGGRGNTLKESLTGFRIAIPEGAKSLDITLAATPVRRVEFLARPVLTQPPLAD